MKYILILPVDEEITLRMLAARDAKSLFKLTNQSRDYLRQWLPWIDNTKTEQDSYQYIINSFQIYAEQKGLSAGIFYHDTLVGVIGFNEFDWKNNIGYIGYWLGQNYQGHGIMTRSVCALIEYAFYELELNRIDIRAATGNKRSCAIPERLGFKKEGLLRQAEWLYDYYVDHFVYGMLKTDWEDLKTGDNKT